jgi:hypothetical protein
MSSVREDTLTGCWEWIGQISNSGYGRTTIRDPDGSMRMESAHRASYEVFVGPIPDGARVRQTCDNRLCINPDHLELIDPGTGG